VAYATPEELAAALRVAPTLKNVDLLEACINAASVEIDHEADRVTEPIPPDDPLAHMVCIGRGVEWYKVNDAAFGAIGFVDTGVLAAPKDTFARWAAVLIPLKDQYGVA
jgi:hypothetical protein